MHIIKAFPIVFLFSCLVSCTTFKTIDYFRLEEDKVESYNGFFVNWNNDTLEQRTEIVNKTFLIDGEKAFYCIETKDTIDIDPIIGSRHFLFSAIIFKDNSILIAPIFWKQDLLSLKIKDFKVQFPSVLTKNTRITYSIDESTTIITGFRKTSIVIEDKKFNCLYFELNTSWPDDSYKAMVWLNKKHGILKWIRTTGRIETRILNYR